MRAELMMIGTELLLGEIVDTNAAYLGRKLAECGIDLYYKSTVGDNLARGEAVLNLALERSDLVIISGGLGPTSDDLTRELVCQVASVELVRDEKAFAELLDWHRTRYGAGVEMTQHNEKQAYFPQGSTLLPNPVGTAPGFWLEYKEKIIVALPGVPTELKTIFSQSVLPKLLTVAGKDRLVTRNLNFIGIGEAQLQTVLDDLIAQQSNPTIALYASGGKVRARLTAKAESVEAGEKLLAPLISDIKNRTQGYLYGLDGESLEEVVGRQLSLTNRTVAVAESCTGGLVGHLLTNVPGSSAYFLRGYTVYSNEAKIQDLGVPADVIKTYGAVSAETAKAMAEGVQKKAGSDYGVAITGIAGPGGGSSAKPVGLVYISLASFEDTIVQKANWRGTREQIKARSALAALRLLWQASH